MSLVDQIIADLREFISDTRPGSSYGLDDGQISHHDGIDDALDNLEDFLPYLKEKYTIDPLGRWQNKHERKHLPRAET